MVDNKNNTFTEKEIEELLILANGITVSLEKNDSVVDATNKAPITEEAEIIKKTSEIQNIRHTETFMSFIYKYNIKNGNNKIKSRLLYSIYKKIYGSKKINYYEFTVLCNNIFKNANGFLYLNVDESLLLKEYSKTKRIIKQEPQIKTLSYNNELIFNMFLKRYNIERGDSYIEGDLLYFLFSIFAKRKKVKISKENFYNYLNLFFEYKQIQPTLYWYKVDPKIKQKIAVETIQAWRTLKNDTSEKIKEDFKENEKIIEKEQQEKQS